MGVWEVVGIVVLVLLGIALCVAVLGFILSALSGGWDH